MKFLDRPIKYSFLLLGVVLMLNACSSTGSKNNAKSGNKKTTSAVSDIGKKELGGDLEERLKRAEVYTKNNILLSVLNNDRVGEKCKFDAEKDWKDWGRMLRIGFKCATEEQWKTVYEVGHSFSIHHIDAPWGAYFLSLVSEKAGDMPRAVWMAGLAARKAPENAVIEYQKARLLWLQNQKDAAFHSAKKAYELEPNLTEAALLMAQIYFSDYEFQNAEKYFRKVLDKNDKEFTAMLGVAESLVQQDKAKDSIPYFVKSIRLKKSRLDLAYRIAGLLENDVKDYKKAIEWYEKISEVFPKEIISKEKTEVQDKIKSLQAKLEAKNNPPKKAVAKKSKDADEKREPASENNQASPNAGQTGGQ